MNILLTGANGYIGKRLLPVLIDEGHQVYACVRDKNTLHLPTEYESKVVVIEIDFLDEAHLKRIPIEIHVVYYLMHALASSSNNFSEKEVKIARNFNRCLNNTDALQVIYLGGISNDDNLSEHLRSRQHTEAILKESKVPLTVLRAAIIIGSGGASFEIIRDLVEKLPFMIAPKWLNTECQPIGIRNVIEYLLGSLANKQTFNKTYDIGGPEILTYKQMLLQFAIVRGMKRYIQTVPVMSPRISSYWLYFVTSTSYRIAVNLVESMKNRVIVEHFGIQDVIDIKLLTYKESVSLAFRRIEQNHVVSSWVDSELPKCQGKSLSHYITVPTQATFTDVQNVEFGPGKLEQVLKNIWSIGGDRGWYYGNWLWRIRGVLDKLAGGVGLRRGRRSPIDINTGDSLDFWRVLFADKKGQRLLLFAEMKLPGEAWLEFKIIESNNGNVSLIQTATFRPKGLMGRLYWYSVLPFHVFIFKNMARNLVQYK